MCITQTSGSIPVDPWRVHVLLISLIPRQNRGLSHAARWLYAQAKAGASCNKCC